MTITLDQYQQKRTEGLTNGEIREIPSGEKLIFGHAPRREQSTHRRLLMDSELVLKGGIEQILDPNPVRNNLETEQNISKNSLDQKLNTGLLSVEQEIFPGKYLALVRTIAFNLVRRLPGHIDVDDLIGDGYLGLMDGIGKYQPDKNPSLKTYLGMRIYGAMIDGLRKYNQVSRQFLRQKRDLAKAERELNKRGLEPNDRDIAEFLGITLEKLHKMKFEANRFVTSLNTPDDEDNDQTIEDSLTTGENPEKIMSGKERELVYKMGVGILPKQEKEVITDLFYGELTLKEIGKNKRFAESRASQIKTSARKRLRESSYIKDYEEGKY